jgi:hypothetical protein
MSGRRLRGIRFEQAISCDSDRGRNWVGGLVFYGAGGRGVVGSATGVAAN